MNLRLPAEWEIQDGVLLSWPHEDTDWNDNLDDAQNVYIEVIKNICRFERVLLTAHNVDAVSSILINAGIDTSKINIVHVPNNDTWARDFGPITVFYHNAPVLMDFGFNGWGLKFPANHDNMISKKLKADGHLKPNMNTIGLILEGGSIESDGIGTILTTSQCLMSQNRNPQLGKSEIEQALSSLLGAKRVLWLDNGYLAGDDTDSHIDTLARICPDNTILYQGCNDSRDEHFEPLELMKAELQSFKAFDGSQYNLIELPWPKARFDEFGHRLPATYANFLIINNAVLVPTYDDFENDNMAMEKIKLAFPNHEIIGINCLPLIRQHGSLHCITMQLPQGVMA